MIKKFLLTSTLLLLISIYVIINHTNFLGEPTYTLNSKTELIIDSIPIEYDIEPIIKNNSVFVDLNTIKNQLDVDITWDSKNNTAVIYENDKIYRIYGGTNELKINMNNKIKGAFIYKLDGQPMISLDLVKEWKNFDYSYVDNFKKVIIDNKRLILRTGNVIKDIRLRESKSIWSEVKDIIKIDDNIYVYKEDDEWSYVRTQRGIFGYIKNDDFIKGNNIQYTEDVKSHTNKVKTDKINMTWEYVYKVTPKVEKLKEIKGLDVISPTWFSLEDDEGSIKDKGNKEYMNWALNNGYRVWGLFDNSFDPDLTSEIINDSYLREKVIESIIRLATYYKLDGINIDFENVYLSDKDMFTQFIKELSPVARENNIVLSIDVTVKSLSENWSMFYDRKEIGKLVDYVILMAYDEYWAGGGVSGPVASIPWVERGILTLLDEVTNEKVILGVPYYTRVWKEDYLGKKLNVDSYAVSMSRVKELIKENDGVISWDDNNLMNYGEYHKGNAIYKVWLEDEASMNQRIDLIKKYNLSGIASWRRGFEEEIIWDIINKNLNNN